MPGFSTTGLAPAVLDALPQARHIAQLGKLMWQRGEVIAAEQVERVYLREQVAWKKAGQTASGEQ